MFALFFALAFVAAFALVTIACLALRLLLFAIGLIVGLLRPRR